MLHRVIDTEPALVIAGTYDLAFFASGYEKRCTYVARQLDKKNVVYPFVLAFDEIRSDDQRRENDKYFAAHWTDKQIQLSSHDDGPIYDLLRAFRGHRKKLRILVDYSSMSRLWYAGILNWAKFAEEPSAIDIDLIYAVGQHQEPSLPMVINDIVCIPGCEGGPVPLSRSVAIFGLGFEGLAALCVWDQLEPQEIYAYLAQPAAFDDYAAKARAQNQELIAHANATFELPLGSVESTFRHLAELIALHRSSADITLIPMGPKPHVLAALLLALRFEEIACLRVSGERIPPEQVGTTGDLVATRVEFRSTKRLQVGTER